MFNTRFPVIRNSFDFALKVKSLWHRANDAKGSFLKQEVTNRDSYLECHHDEHRSDHHQSYRWRINNQNRTAIAVRL
jgi:hypothetical protein